MNSSRVLLQAFLLAVLTAGASIQAWTPPAVAAGGEGTHLQRAKVYLKAGDYRRALEACQSQIQSAPSVESYTYLTYVYHALNGYLNHLATSDQWVRVEQLYINLAVWRTEDLVDPPEVLARVAKELIEQAVQRQADVTAAMAARLDEGIVSRLWKEQAAWRRARPDDWWSGIPPEWAW